MAVTQAELEPSGIQDLADAIPQLLEIKNKANLPLAFSVRVEFGDGEKTPDSDSVAAINKLLESINEDFKLL